MINKIHIPIRHVETLDNRVKSLLDGNDCQYETFSTVPGKEKKVVSVLRGKYVKRIDRLNIFNNWGKAVESFDGEIFIGMDSDIFIQDGIIEFLKNSLRFYNFVCIESDKNRRGHAIWAVKGRTLKKIPFEWGHRFLCPVCSYIRELQFKKARVLKVTEITLQEIPEERFLT